MISGISAVKGDLSLNVKLSPEPTGQRRSSRSDAVRTARREHVGLREGGKFGETLFMGLLDQKITSATLASLARTAANSGKRLILEIRDENPVQIVRTTTRGS